MKHLKKFTLIFSFLCFCFCNAEESRIWESSGGSAINMTDIKDLTIDFSSFGGDLFGISEEEIYNIVKTKLKRLGLKITTRPPNTSLNDFIKTPLDMTLKIDVFEDIKIQPKTFYQFSLVLTERAFFERTGNPTSGENWSNHITFLYNDKDEIKTDILKIINYMVDNFSKDYLKCNPQEKRKTSK